MDYNICGIQQVGVGVKNVHEAWKWYRQAFGVDVPVFEEAAVAGLMLPYTGGQPQSRHAILAMNMQGGGGFEIWQYTKRIPKAAAFHILLGDTGIYAIKIKCYNIQKTFDYYKSQGFNLLSGIERNPIGESHFWLEDPFKNVFQLVEYKDWFQNTGKLTGGVCGVVIGTTHMDEAKKLYKDILGYDKIVYEENNIFNDFKPLAGGENPFNRVLLRHSEQRQGAFSRLLGATDIELVQTFERTPNKIFQNRFWGELGYIHLCFDVIGIESLKYRLNTEGYAFTVDSANSFDMGAAAGRFSYIEDPDGTLIEFVETHKVPVLKSIGWYLNLKNRDPKKPLPKWMLMAMGLNRVT
jgi:catechol 2,3-dioxygenase-like lactoylglutathione lyase family enzyme